MNEMAKHSAGQRLDQWLWCARLSKSRTLAQVLIDAGKVRLNRAKVSKSSHLVKVGDVITIALGPRVRVVEVVGLAKTRRPAPEAARLFRELTPISERTTCSLADNGGSTASAVPVVVSAIREPGSGRPTKRDRRLTDRLKRRFDPE